MTPPFLTIRHGLRVRGTVQGVGFRPTVYRLATRSGFSGLVRNDAEGVWIEIEGPPPEVEAFPEVLRAEAPPLSRIDAIQVSALEPQGEGGFAVVSSDEAGEVRAALPADAATCQFCLHELFDPADRRYRYAFLNCTDCGPRYTLARQLPYDRERTTMSDFPLCATCRAEYEDPDSRRFHAEPNACPECGPTLELQGEGLEPQRGDAALQAAIELLRAGRIVAVKGLGGFSLAVDARNELAVARLRQRKQRPDKPLAVMAADLDEVRRIAEPTSVTEAALQSPARPIVLLRALPLELSGLAASVAPGLKEVGVMLPYTPLHHLLLQSPLRLLVMTSGNLSEEPIARTNADARVRLKGIADACLLHDREIHARADDSVVREIAGAVRMVRRARGHVPNAIPLGFEAPSILAVGAELKNTVCLTRGGEAVLSPHVGDLENAETHAFFVEVIARLQELVGTEPVAVAHDLHPDYASTRWALHSGLPRIAVQHHHAHLASCLVEHRRTSPVIGVAFDGTGCGPAGELWGGEILLADLETARRLGHLRPLPLLGGEAAIRAPWRLAFAALLDAGESLEPLRRIGIRPLEQLQRVAGREALLSRATGAGRWFDAIAALIGLRDEVSYEAQAAVELEALAPDGPVDAYPFDFAEAASGQPWSVDLRPLVRAVSADLRQQTGAPEIAARFHETMAQVVAQACARARESTGVETVALSGGCFQNRRLTERSTTLLRARGFEVLLQRLVPCNDGGLALGQAAVAAARLNARKKGGPDVPGHPW